MLTNEWDTQTVESSLGEQLDDWFCMVSGSYLPHQDQAEGAMAVRFHSQYKAKCPQSWLFGWSRPVSDLIQLVTSSSQSVLALCIWLVWSSSDPSHKEHKSFPVNPQVSVNLANFFSYYIHIFLENESNFTLINALIHMKSHSHF